MPFARETEQIRPVAPKQRTPLPMSPGSTTDPVDEERIRFAAEWALAVSQGWEQVVHLLESCCKDHATRQTLRSLTSD